MDLWILEYRFTDDRFNSNAQSNGWTLSSRGYLTLEDHIRYIQEDILKADPPSYYSGQKVNWRLRSASEGDTIPVEILI